MGRVRAWLAAAVVAAVWIGCGSSSSTSTLGVDGGGPDGASDGPLGSDGNAPGCPATQPSDGTACGAPGTKSCNYGCSECSCSTEGWYCAAPGCSGLTQCPATAPSDGASCATGGGCCGGTQESPCMYTDDGGTTTATCTSSVWHVTTSTDGGTD